MSHDLSYFCALMNSLSNKIYHAHHGTGRVWVNFVSQTCSGGGLMLELDAELHVNMSKKTQE